MSAVHGQRVLGAFILITGQDGIRYPHDRIRWLWSTTRMNATTKPLSAYTADI